jgi:hypothetical protein
MVHHCAPQLHAVFPHMSACATVVCSIGARQRQATSVDVQHMPLNAWRAEHAVSWLWLQCRASTHMLPHASCGSLWQQMCAASAGKAWRAVVKIVVQQPALQSDGREALPPDLTSTSRLRPGVMDQRCSPMPASVELLAQLVLGLPDRAAMGTMKWLDAVLVKQVVVSLVVALTLSTLAC